MLANLGDCRVDVQAKIAMIFAPHGWLVCGGKQMIVVLRSYMPANVKENRKLYPI